MLRRILLSEAALILQAGFKDLCKGFLWLLSSSIFVKLGKVCSWEMRLVWPAGRPPVGQQKATDIVGQQPETWMMCTVCKSCLFA